MNRSIAATAGSRSPARAWCRRDHLQQLDHPCSRSPDPLQLPLPALHLREDLGVPQPRSVLLELVLQPPDVGEHGEELGPRVSADVCPLREPLDPSHAIHPADEQAHALADFDLGHRRLIPRGGQSIVRHVLGRDDRCEVEARISEVRRLPTRLVLAHLEIGVEQLPTLRRVGRIGDRRPDELLVVALLGDVERKVVAVRGGGPGTGIELLQVGRPHADLTPPLIETGLALLEQQRGFFALVARTALRIDPRPIGHPLVEQLLLRLPKLLRP